jgi:hypothetical protein
VDHFTPERAKPRIMDVINGDCGDPFGRGDLVEQIRLDQAVAVRV